MPARCAPDFEASTLIPKTSSINHEPDSLLSRAPRVADFASAAGSRPLKGDSDAPESRGVLGGEAIIVLAESRLPRCTEPGWRKGAGGVYVSARGICSEARRKWATRQYSGQVLRANSGQVLRVIE